MNSRKFLALGLLSLLLIFGVWYFSSPTLSQPDIIAREQGFRQSLAPVGADTSGDTQTSTNYEAIEPVVVNLADVPPGQYVPNNMYERWLRGESASATPANWTSICLAQGVLLKTRSSPSRTIKGSSPTTCRAVKIA